jgi:protein tyrosine phosphatase (PTP) superfamily phosphohydrolase (DUF442 family)
VSARVVAAALLSLCLFAGCAASHPHGHHGGATPNMVVVSERLVTAGQPSPAALSTLRDEGYGAVVYLAPPSVPDAVRDEPAIVERQGLAFVNIPIDFRAPTERDFDAFAAALARFEGRKVLVHCQVNMRASSMVFLHRVIVGKEPPEAAYERTVARVWSPNATWKRFIVSTLRRHGVEFEPY